VKGARLLSGHSSGCGCGKALSTGSRLARGTATLFGTTTKILTQCRGRSSQPFEPNNIGVVDRAYAKLGKTGESIRQNEVALKILEALIVKR
jgi:hypothetical protein